MDSDMEKSDLLENQNIEYCSADDPLGVLPNLQAIGLETLEGFKRMRAVDSGR